MTHLAGPELTVPGICSNLPITTRHVTYRESMATNQTGTTFHVDMEIGETLADGVVHIHGTDRDVEYFEHMAASFARAAYWLRQGNPTARTRAA